jgi:hypothetical protein
MAISRKDFLKGAGAFALSRVLRGQSTQDLPPPDELWAWLGELAQWCPAFPGSAGQASYLNFLEEQLRAARLSPQRRTIRTPYVDVHSIGLKLGDDTIHVCGYRPFSGVTPPSGIVAPLYNAGTALQMDLKKARGKIVLVEMSPATIRAERVRLGEILGTYPVRSAVPTVAYGALTGAEEARDMKPMESAGAVGVVFIWSGISDANAEGQIAPYNALPSKIPAVWVNATEGARLKAAAGAEVRLTLDALNHPNAPCDDLRAILPGKSTETIVIDTHTGGANACAASGGLGVVALARYFSANPPHRTLVFQMRSTESRDAPLMKSAVATLEIENLGAMEWIDQPEKNSYKASGGYEWAVAYTSSPAQASVFLKSVEGTEAKRTYAVKRESAVPAIAYQPTPQYLHSAMPGGGLDKLDKNRIYGEILAFARTIEALDRMSAGEIADGGAGRHRSLAVAARLRVIS